MTRCVNTKQSQNFITTHTEISIEPDGYNEVAYPSGF
jgi:hypothetical protein